MNDHSAHAGMPATTMKMKKNAYGSLAAQTAASFVIMYLVMFSMIDGLGSFYNNLNMFYMTVMMAAPMAVIMVLAMRGMFRNGAANMAIIAASAMLFLGSFWAIRTQTTIGDRALLRSMIPHHSGAILMCEQAKLRDAENVALCANIVRSQRDEIEQMKRILNRL